ncbi:MAG: endonuclease domain-containing protein [Patescibacteria group bacterium]
MKNRKKLENRRRDLRKSQTKTEQIVWLNIRNRKLGRYRFVRQFSIGPYILDFYCPATKLAVELDGSKHETKIEQEYDRNRDDYLNEAGIKVLRFKNSEVENSLPSVLSRIHLSCRTREGETKSG